MKTLKKLSAMSALLLAFLLSSTGAFAQTASGNPGADAAGPYKPVALAPGLLAADSPVGSFYVGDGPYWGEDPPTYTCLETCAMLFGGETADYECSTQGDSVDNMAWASAWGSGLHCADLGGEPIAEDYKVGTSTDCGEPFCYVSTYVSDWCDLEGQLEASENFCYNISGVILVNVTKEFSDGNDAEVDVKLTCNTGIPLEQPFTIAGGDEEGVTFVVRDIPESGADCEVTESGGPAGYTTVLNGGDGCSWENLTGGRFSCEITNVANPATYTVYKDFTVFGKGGDVVVGEADVTIECDSEIDGGWEDDGTWYLSDTLGDGETLVATVDTTEGPAHCSASEEVSQSGVESVAVGCDGSTLQAGGSHTCTFTNTVFFEGIPTMSQYGLALLVLLTLGVGFVGLRRFV